MNILEEMIIWIGAAVLAFIFPESVER
uniref:Uncharacterized protein n=1 Tax=Marseillevirus LCMAC202 TaxID=2506606 RepID=A0A481YYF8_9VIRU|nr:MAG: hypothetical protein LCMAC202_03120 [Marseillevirus LCMAC202]